MIDDMDIFRTRIDVENPTRPGVTRRVESVMVDTGSEYTWLPRAVLEELARGAGFGGGGESIAVS